MAKMELRKMQAEALAARQEAQRLKARDLLLCGLGLCMCAS